MGLPGHENLDDVLNRVTRTNQSKFQSRLQTIPLRSLETIQARVPIRFVSLFSSSQGTGRSSRLGGSFIFCFGASFLLVVSGLHVSPGKSPETCSTQRHAPLEAFVKRVLSRSRQRLVQRHGGRALRHVEAPHQTALLCLFEERPQARIRQKTRHRGRIESGTANATDVFQLHQRCQEANVALNFGTLQRKRGGHCVPTV